MAAPALNPGRDEVLLVRRIQFTRMNLVVAPLARHLLVALVRKMNVTERRFEDDYVRQARSGLIGGSRLVRQRCAAGVSGLRITRYRNEQKGQ